MAQLSQFHFQILLSVSLFSLLVLSSPFLLYLMRFICFQSDRKYIFLVCNGILVFLIRNSGLTHLSPPETSVTNYEHVNKETVRDQQPAPKLVYKSDIEVQVEQGRDSKDLVTARTERNGVLSIEEDGMMTQEEEDDTRAREEEDDTRAREEEDDTMAQEEEDDTMTREEEEDDSFVIREEEEEETSLLSAKELNKMCDDFIKKMRRGIHI